jgi:hypothetical protein
MQALPYLISCHRLLTTPLPSHWSPRLAVTASSYLDEIASMQDHDVTSLADTATTAVTMCLRGKYVACSIARCGGVCPPRATSANLEDPSVFFVETTPPPYEMSWIGSGWKDLQAHDQAKVCNTKPAQACRSPISRMPSGLPMKDGGEYRRLLMPWKKIARL